jgi:hypothetical protein
MSKFCLFIVRKAELLQVQHIGRQLEELGVKENCAVCNE